MGGRGLVLGSGFRGDLQGLLPDSELEPEPEDRGQTEDRLLHAGGQQGHGSEDARRRLPGTGGRSLGGSKVEVLCFSF